MPARWLTNVTPAPAGFELADLSKRQLLSGTVVLLVDRLDTLLAVLPDAADRMCGLVLTPGADQGWQRLGPALWRLPVDLACLPAIQEICGAFAEAVADAFAVNELAERRTVELARSESELVSTRRDYHASVNSLSESEERFRSLVETSRDWIWALDTSSRYSYSSPRVRDLLGYEAQEMLGRSYFDLMPAAEAARVRPHFEEAVRERRPLVNLENANLHRDGRLVILETSAVPVLDRQGNWLGYRGVDRDITARKHSEEERLQLERRILHSQKLESLGILAGGIAHDFNNLLVAVLGNAELALMDMAGDAPGRGAVLDIRRAALRASDLTNQMLAYSGKGHFVIEPIDLSELVREMTQLLSVSVCKRAQIQQDLTAGLPAIEGDAAQIRQVVMNLVTNASEAIESTEGHGVITLRTRQVDIADEGWPDRMAGGELRQGAHVALEITDTGSGMSDEVRARLFDPFFTTKFQGRGLGMAAVQGIVRGHHGALTIRSQPGQGTSITILLPTTGSMPETTPDAPPAAAHAWQGHGTALVIDDDDNVRDFTRRILGRLGFTVLTAENGARGVDVFQDHARDITVVVLDLTMPVMGGEQTFLELQRLRPGVPVLLASGYNEQDATSRFTGAGLAGFIKKPFTIQELTRAVQLAMEGRVLP